MAPDLSALHSSVLSFHSNMPEEQQVYIFKYFHAAYQRHSAKNKYISYIQNYTKLIVYIKVESTEL